MYLHTMLKVKNMEEIENIKEKGKGERHSNTYTNTC